MKKIIVQKYGGSSVANVERIQRVAKRVAGYYRKGYNLVVIVSALGDTTDELVDLAHKISPMPAGREMDTLLSTGEQISTALLSMALHEENVPALSLLAFQVGISTDSVFTRARILGINPKRIQEELKTNKVVIVAGFQGVNERNEITTLGRGGSDLSAVAIARVLKAHACEIYTDVTGIFTTDPRMVKTARKIGRISYEEMLELASAGAQVMQARSIELAGKYDVPIHVRSSFNNEKGTWIVKGDKSMEDVLVRGVTLNRNEAKITITRVPNRPGNAAKIFRALADKGINVDMIVQNISHRDNVTDISFTVPATDVQLAQKSIERVVSRFRDSRVLTNRSIAKISVVGIGMRSHSGVAASMFEALGRQKVNIEMISTSEIKISCVVEEKDAKKAVAVLHRHFKLDQGKHA